MRRLATTLSTLGLLWAAAATFYLLAGAGYDGVGTTALVTGADADVAHVPVSLASANGPWVVGLLLGVTLAAGIPVGVALTHPRGHRATAATVGLTIGAFSVVSGFSVGLMYLPVALALMAAALTSPEK